MIIWILIYLNIIGKKTNLVKIKSREYVLKHDANMTSYTIFNSIIENQT
jgi:hypothetical protein